MTCREKKRRNKKIIGWIIVVGIFGFLALGFWLHRYNLTYSQFVTNLKDIAIAGAAIYTAIYGARALDQWRKELLGTDQYRLVKKIANQTTEVARRLHQARSYGTTPEIEEKFNNLDDEDKQIDINFMQRELKIKMVQESILVLEQLNWEARLFDINVKEYIQKFIELEIKLSNANYVVSRYKVRYKGEQELNKLYVKSLKELSGPENDNLGERIDEVADKILKEMRKKIKKFTNDL